MHGRTGNRASGTYITPHVLRFLPPETVPPQYLYDSPKNVTDKYPLLPTPLLFFPPPRPRRSPPSPVSPIMVPPATGPRRFPTMSTRVRLQFRVVISPGDLLRVSTPRPVYVFGRCTYSFLSVRGYVSPYHTPIMTTDSGTQVR